MQDYTANVPLLAKPKVMGAVCYLASLPKNLFWGYRKQVWDGMGTAPFARSLPSDLPKYPRTNLRLSASPAQPRTKNGCIEHALAFHVSSFYI